MKLLIAATASLTAQLLTGVNAMPADCGASNMVLQFLHLQDVSYSATDNKAELIPQISALTNGLASQFFRRETAVAKFSDKGVRPHGDPNGDICYGRHRSFRDQGYRNSLENLGMLSGLDWKEAQLEAILKAVEDPDLGWLPAVDPETSKAVLRVIAMVTDSLPHERGVFPEKPVDSTLNCKLTDYPSVAQISTLLDTNDTHVIVVSTGDVYSNWVELLGSVPKARVIRFDEFSSLGDEIREILCEQSPV